VASTKKGAILLVTSNEEAVALHEYVVLLFADFNKTVLRMYVSHFEVSSKIKKFYRLLYYYV